MPGDATHATISMEQLRCHWRLYFAIVDHFTFPTEPSMQRVRDALRDVQDFEPGRVPLP